MSVTSCLNGDDDNKGSAFLDKNASAMCYQAIQGNYSGNLIYAAKNAADVSDVTDTLAVSWSFINDSTLIVPEFPVGLIASKVTKPELKEALEKAGNRPLKCNFKFVNASPIQFILNPLTLDYSLDYEGGSHKVQIAFYTNVYDSFGSYDQTKKILYMKIITGAIFVDDKQTAYLPAIPYVFLHKK